MVETVCPCRTSLRRSHVCCSCGNDELIQQAVSLSVQSNNECVGIVSHDTLWNSLIATTVSCNFLYFPKQVESDLKMRIFYFHEKYSYMKHKKVIKIDLDKGPMLRHCSDGNEWIWQRNCYNYLQNPNAFLADVEPVLKSVLKNARDGKTQ